MKIIFPKSYQEIGYIVGGGALSAFLLLYNILHPSYINFSLFFVQLPLFFVALSLGIQAQIFALLIGLLVLLPFVGIYSLIVFSLTLFGPSLAFTYLAFLHKKNLNDEVFWYPTEYLLSFFVYYGIGLATFIFFLFGIFDKNNNFIPQLAKMIAENFNSQKLETQNYHQLAQIFANLIPLFVSLWMIFVTFINASLAQYILKKNQRNIRPSFEVELIEFPWNLWILVAFTGIASFITSGALKQIFINSSLILLVAFACQGLSIIYFFQKKEILQKGFFGFFYFLLIVLGWPIVIVILLGIFEPWLKTRQRFNIKTGD